MRKAHYFLIHFTQKKECKIFCKATRDVQLRMGGLTVGLGAGEG